MGGMMWLAEKAVEYFEDFDGFLEWIRKFEKVGLLRVHVVSKEHKYLQIDGAVSTALHDRCDPLTVLVALGFAFFGPYWVQMPDAEDAFKYVKRWWHKKIKEKKSQNAS